MPYGTKWYKKKNKKQKKKKTNMQILWFKWSWSWDSLPSSVPKSYGPLDGFDWSPLKILT